MEKINLNQIKRAENFNEKNEGELSNILSCLREECGVDGTSLTGEDLNLYRNFKDGSMSVDNFRIYRDRVFNNNRDNLSNDRKDFFAYIASKVMVDNFKRDIRISNKNN